ncbi:DUF1592 domain-containing protein [Haloferula rosea]|uniref:DUF1592 domain-containing protein n=2 Tax=Haloferula rosea TaxID=490093 RepID=A0A934VG50_9BACT|nr:DUF1592 domain-containing protein [Haloferula rosea]
MSLPFIVRPMKLWPVWLACAGSAVAEPSGQHHGRQIYQKLCVECHGANGEGNDEEFVDPLYGEKSVEALARRIHRTMPEDEEHLCVDDDAAAVAAYIHQAFYSPQARAGLNPPRRDLVRLTAPQFKQSVADVVGRFMGGHGRLLPEKRGLSFKASGLHEDSAGKNKFTNVKRHQFERSGEDLTFNVREMIGEEPITTRSDITVNLSGSILAEETGSYEFVVRSANGFRLRVNQDHSQLAVLDRWVASGKDIREAGVRVELVGGRPYALHFETVVSPKDQHATTEVLWKTPHGALERIPKRFLYSVWSPPVAVVTTSFPADDASYGYERGSGISKDWLLAVNRGAIEAADFVEANLNRLAKTKAGAKDRDRKVREFLGRFVEAALRRPLDSDEQKSFLEGPINRADGVIPALRPVVVRALTSPEFLYPELPQGEGGESRETAARLALVLWDSVPDEALAKAAAKRQLDSPQAIERQARRMLDDPRARLKVRGFFHHWLEMDRAEDVSKDHERFPGFDEQLMADLRISLELFLDEIVWSESSDFRQLLLADYLMLNPRLAKVYGEQPTQGGFQKVAFDSRKRTGVITHPYLLATLAYHDNTSPIHRGVFLTRNIVGQQLKPPPEATAFKDADFDPTMTMREKVSELTRDKSCMACHSTINPLGFSLEHYDAIGRWRAKDGGRAIDASSDFLPETGDRIRLRGARDVAEFAASSPIAHRAFVRQMFHHLVKHGMASYGRDADEHLYRRFRDSDFNIRELCVAIAKVAALGSGDSSSAQHPADATKSLHANTQ